jgi:hypothetical protein
MNKKLNEDGARPSFEFIKMNSNALKIDETTAPEDQSHDNSSVATSSNALSVDEIIARRLARLDNDSVLNELLAMSLNTSPRNALLSSEYPNHPNEIVSIELVPINSNPISRDEIISIADANFRSENIEHASSVFIPCDDDRYFWLKYGLLIGFITFVLLTMLMMSVYSSFYSIKKIK